MNMPFIERVDANGTILPIADSEIDVVLRQGAALHCDFRPDIRSDYLGHLKQMATEGACIMQLVDGGDVRAIAVWRTFLTTYCGRRFEIDDLVTAADHRSKGYGATLIKALERKARALSCETVMLASATRRVDAHRFYFRERFAIDAFLFSKTLS